MTGVGTARSAARGVRRAAPARVMFGGRHTVALTIVALVALLVSCSGDDASSTAATTGGSASSAASASTTEPGVSEEEAVAAARSALTDEDPDFDFDATRVHVSRIEGDYDVSFVPVDLAGPGGEPHVVIDSATGEVLETYLTR